MMDDITSMSIEQCRGELNEKNKLINSQRANLEVYNSFRNQLKKMSNGELVASKIPLIQNIIAKLKSSISKEAHANDLSALEAQYNNTLATMISKETYTNDLSALEAQYNNTLATM
ncbi:MAG: hypothetical protein AABY27_02145, partial [Pseudomonadota bacterium]